MAHRRKPGRGADAKGHSKRTARHVQVMTFLMESAAWRSLPPAPRALFFEVLRRYNGVNNGRIGLGVREAGRELHIKPQTAGTAFRALVERGFLVETQGASFHQKKLTREWRITCKPMGPADAPTAAPTEDYTRWRPAPEKQKPVPFGGTLSAVRGHDPAGNVTLSARTVSPNGTMADSLSAVWGHPYTIHAGGESEPREAEPSDAQRSAADAPTAIQLPRLKRMPV
jgi:hypothetical protein